MSIQKLSFRHAEERFELQVPLDFRWWLIAVRLSRNAGAGMGTLRNIGLWLLLAGWCFSGSPALAEKRVALIIGNSSYDKVARLPNPANYAALVAETLKTAGFDDVSLRRDLKIADMRRALRDFVDKSRDADVAVIYMRGTASKSTA